MAQNQKPNNYPPALVKFLFGSGINAGDINIGSFYLTLLDLINRKFVSVKIICKKNKVIEKRHEVNNYWKRSDSWKKPVSQHKTLDKIILKINKQFTAKLHPFEKNVLRCINTLKCKGNMAL